MIIFKNKSHVLFSLLILSFGFCAHSFADENAQALDPLQKMIKRSSLLSPEVIAGHPYYVEVAGLSDFGLAARGARVDLGYRFGFFGVDLRGSFGKTPYSGIRVMSDNLQTSGAGWPDQFEGAELTRERSDQDQWTYKTVEPGIFIESRLFPELFPLLTERARVGFSFGTFEDQTNAISFSSYLFTVEAAFIEQLGSGSRWAVNASVFWNTGNLYSKNIADETSDADRNLPVNFVGSSLGFSFAF